MTEHQAKLMWLRQTSIFLVGVSENRWEVVLRSAGRAYPFATEESARAAMKLAAPLFREIYAGHQV